MHGCGGEAVVNNGHFHFPQLVFPHLFLDQLHTIHADEVAGGGDDDFPKRGNVAVCRENDNVGVKAETNCIDCGGQGLATLNRDDGFHSVQNDVDGRADDKQKNHVHSSIPFLTLVQHRSSEMSIDISQNNSDSEKNQRVPQGFDVVGQLGFAVDDFGEATEKLNGHGHDDKQASDVEKHFSFLLYLLQ